jgi:hypothetical protein
MSITNDQLIEHVSKMSVLDLANLVKELETKFGVSAAPVAVAGVPVATAPGSLPCLACAILSAAFLATSSGLGFGGGTGHGQRRIM